MTRLALAAVLSLLPLTATAAQPLADGTRIRPEDVARLEALDRATGAALRQALGQGSAAQAADAADTLRGAALAATPEALVGDWSCRMTKIGGLQASVSYPPFRCAITRDGTALRFEKLTGSQRTSGTLHHDGGVWVYLGSTFVAGEAPRPYADFPDDMDTQGTETLPDVGVLEPIDADRARILFPLPYRESVLNVLTLTR
ncbi:DUF4893 domain-containing protein [Paracoccus sanguinis]|uniref:DUF4893 domain-containing protein n=1 Tax=Paracoccus sanguinis TaxID=1545044 RepID=UPI00051FE935|nr:DUF4893 domain-containing protein [Paracoccus sanguinis]KGJ15293.1 hypothetical protein IX54_02370 [Paracoccus sanguinis]KGJ15340.1 hypothetical protein IX54_02665 [Paracoccus sanguinis]